MARLSKIVYDAIRFYGDRNNWSYDADSGVHLPEAPAFLDGGQMAQELMALVDASPKTMPMLLPEAETIMEHLVRLALYSEGIICASHAQESAAALADTRLEDMLEARNILSAVNQLPVATGESKTIYVIVEPRLIAALYCTLTYAPSSVIAITPGAHLAFLTNAGGEDHEDTDMPEFLTKQ